MGAMSANALLIRVSRATNLLAPKLRIISLGGKMKRFILLILMLSVMLMAAEPMAAFEKGTIGLGGTVSLGSYKDSADSPTNSWLQLSPSFSYFVFPNLCLDISPGIQISWYDNVDDTYVSFTMVLGARYFYKKFYGGFSFDYSKYGETGDEKHSRKYLKFTLGRLFGIAKNVYLDLGIDYTRGIGKWYRCGYEGCKNYDNESWQLKTRVGVAVFFK